MPDRKAALITGGARRVGRAIALHLAGEGWDIGVHYNSSDDEAQSLRREIEDLGRTCRLYTLDLSDADGADALAKSFCNDFAGAALLVNNASTYTHDTLASLTPEGWDKQTTVNTLAPILLGRAFHGVIRGKGCVVNMLDHKVVKLTPDYFSYTVSKAALASATVMLAMALAPKCRVNGIAPGLLLPSGEQTPPEYERLHVQTPLGRGASVAEVCAAVSFIAATESMTGQFIVIDGGAHLERRVGEPDFPEG